MKKLLILITILGLSSCSLFDKVKKPIIEKASVTAQNASVKHLGCGTGQPVYNDVDEELSKLLKVESKGYKSIGGTICQLALDPIIKRLILEGNEELPQSWLNDGCTLEGFEGDLGDLGTKLCSKL